MNMLILNEEQMATIEALNANGPANRELAPVPLGDGRWALNADLLNDSGPGQTWAHYQQALAGLPVEEVEIPSRTSVE